MTEIAAAVERIRNVGRRKGGLALLAQESGVPYTTVHSFAQRDWSHKNLEVIEKLVAAAERIEASLPADADDTDAAA
jgi:precorrin-6B methylase 1